MSRTVNLALAAVTVFFVVQEGTAAGKPFPGGRWSPGREGAGG